MFTGDVHFYEFEDDAVNSSVYPITRFLSESGVQALPSIDTWREITNNLSDFNFNSSFNRYRNHGANQTEVMRLVLYQLKMSFHS